MKYKHQHVARDDLKLQVVQWGGRMFVELKMIFGTKSSPGIYDNLAKCFLRSVIAITEGISREDVEQHLDDVLAVGLPGEDSAVHVFFRNYLTEAAKAGIVLDSSGNTDKVQPPGTTVTALGVEFDTVAWTWRYKQDKLARILDQLFDIEQGKRAGT